MANSLRELESYLSSMRAKRAGPARAASVRRRRTRARADAMALPVRHAVPGLVPVLSQHSSTTCWATVYTMLHGWKTSSATGIEQALADVGPKWVEYYRSNRGLTASDKVDFLAAAGLIAEPPRSDSVEGWERLLRQYGPLWVTADESPGKLWAIHARIITAIEGDGTPAGTSFRVIDPAAGGRQYREAIAVFVPKFEEEILRNGRVRMQVVHWPRDARPSDAQSSAQQYALPLGSGVLTPGTGVQTAPKRAAAQPAAPVDLDAVVARLIADGADKTALMAFLEEIKAPLEGGLGLQSTQVLPLAQGSEITVELPRGVVLEGAEVIAFRAAVSSALLTVPAAGPVLAALFHVLPELANRANVTIGVGPSVAGGIVTGASFGAGILFAPGNRIGFYGSAGAVLGAIASVSATMQVTVVRGGPEVFGGAATLLGVSVDSSEGPSIAAHAILANGRFVGVTGEVGVSAGLSPFEAFAEFQYTATSLALEHYARQRAAPALFGIAGLTAVEAVQIGLSAVAMAQPLAVQDGGLVIHSDQANRLLTNEARAKLGPKPRTDYQYPLLWVGEIKRGFADALFDVEWQGNAYGEIAGLRVKRNIHGTTTWDKSSLSISFKRVRTLPPNNVKDPREWPIVFEYDGSFDPYGNGHFTFQGQFAANAFGGLTNLRHEISDKSFASFLKLGNKADYVRRKPDRSYTVPAIPADQLTYLEEQLGI